MRNVFLELGFSKAEVEAKVNSAFKSLFEGDPKTESLCYRTGDGLAYIVDSGHGDIRSEGMSYAMTMAALLGKRELFDALWGFAKRYMKNYEEPWKGYFAWQLSAEDFSKLDPGAAPDGEEYFAAALLMAARLFDAEAYKKEALEILEAMVHKAPVAHVEPMIDARTGLVRFSPAQGNDFTDPSYHTLAFYRLFALESGNDFWNRLADRSLEFLKRALNEETGLAADYSEFSGKPKSTPWFPESDCFSGDAWRVIWNLSLDYSTFKKSAWELAAIEKILTFFESRRPYLADYRTDGTAYPKPARSATPGLVAMNATAAIALPDSHRLARPFALDLWNLEIPRGTWRYYDGMLYLLSLLACSGKFRLLG